MLKNHSLFRRIDLEKSEKKDEPNESEEMELKDADSMEEILEENRSPESANDFEWRQSIQEHDWIDFQDSADNWQKTLVLTTREGES